MQNTGLTKFNYDYFTLDAGWFGTSTVQIDEYGRPIPDPKLYPSAVNGNFSSFVQNVQKVSGMKVGLWYMAGAPKPAVEKNTPIKGTQYYIKDIITKDTYCPRWYPDWGYAVNHSHPAAQAWYDSLVELWDSWGVELIKLDCVFAEDESLNHRLDIISLHHSFSQIQRNVVFSLSPGGFTNISVLYDISQYVSMARVTDDFWDTWELYMNEGGGGGDSSGYSHWDAARDLVSAVRSTAPTFWIDLDMLPLGRIGHPGSPCTDAGPGCPRQDRYTQNEKQAIITLWALVQSPFILGGDPTVPNKFVEGILMNENILQMITEITGSHEAMRVNGTGGHYIVWQGDSKLSTDQFIAVFNLLNASQDVQFPWSEFGVFPSCTSTGTKIVDLWTNQALDCSPNFVTSLPQHAVSLLRVKNFNPFE
jgi:hypothetical protein